MRQEEFEALVIDAIGELPQELLAQLDNVAIVVEQWPSRTQIAEAELEHRGELLGLYEGIPLTDREGYNLVLPDKITIFQGPVEAMCDTREEMARVLHDGVLQTLAVITRRSADENLRALAADQERELRAFVSAQHHGPAPLTAALGQIVDTVLRRHRLAVELVVAEDLPDIDDVSVGALTGAVGEALVNVAKHSGADRVVVFVEPGLGDGEVFCSVRDNGIGFDVEEAQSGLGLRHSIRGRIEEIGGRVEIDTKTGRGTEVRLWVS